jgi:D-alanyl-D-alanine carboxypeptidase/D-alanyl-D-alanine-endopeptidase (penicillin-binding protein 4)
MLRKIVQLCCLMGLLQASAAHADLPALLAAFQRLGIAPQHVSVMVQGVQEDALPMLAFNENNALALASTTKLLTSLAAMDVLGPKFSWQTRAYALGTVKEGVLHGDLLIVGGGDARLSSKDLVVWFKKLQKKGVQTVHGNILVHQGMFQTQAADHVNTPVPTPDHPHHGWPEAFVVDGGVIRVELSGSLQGLQVSYRPALDGVQVEQQVVLSKRRCGSITAPVGVTFDDQSMPPRLLVQGEWAPGCLPRQLTFATAPGSRFAALAVAAAWREAGGLLAGSAIAQVDAQGGVVLPKGIKPLGTYSSPLLGDLIRAMNKVSDNLMARHLLLSMAKGFPNRPATLKEARKRFALWREKQGLTAEDVSIDNGSGLSRAERGRAAAMTQLLRTSWRSSWGKTLFDSLPVAGEDGTLANRMTRSLARGNAFMKTGTLTDVRALSGYVRGQSGRIYAVTVLVNDAHADKSLPATDSFIEWLIANG